MSFTKEKIYNLALSALLLGKEISEISTDNSNEVRVFNTHYDIAFESTIQDLDLDSLSQPLSLELLDDLETITSYTGPWRYVYKYPNRCTFFRRIESTQITDNRSTHIAKRVGIYKGQKSIFTNEFQAQIECITNDVPLAALTPMAALAVAYKLAELSAPLLTGKGAKSLRRDLRAIYTEAKFEAQETDKLENFIYEPEELRSEFVEARIS